ncbi:MAG TPA: hypothetical protein VH877_17510 [Polyangia bacterium]|nr:hypothetical protein [Polyangia bacterium]
MTAVAVWDHRPDAAELLAARVARGWRPTPTALQDGDRVLGYAACLVERGPAGEGSGRAG